MSRTPNQPKFVSFLSPLPLMRLFKPEESNTQIAEKLQINASTVSNYRNNKVLIRFGVADELACRLGLHPSSIWGQEWVQVVESKPRTTKKRANSLN
jgi:transcriptional regulator with XRE-family HTH domain